MKKKTYLMPLTSVVEVELQRIIALSTFDDHADGSDALSREKEFEDELENDDLSRRHRSPNVWDDEEELGDNGLQ